MYGEVQVRLQAELEAIRQAGLWKGEHVLEGPQGARVSVAGREFSFAGLSRAEFLAALGRFGITPFQYTADEIVDEAGRE